MAHENATPRPWTVERNTYGVTVRRPSEYGSTPICEIWANGDDRESNAALIVEAVNAYDTLRAENEKLREYAREATKAITSLTAGGSEYFGRKIGDIYTADLPFCLERIQRSKDLLHSLIKDERARTKAAEATIDRMTADRAALSEAQP